MNYWITNTIFLKIYRLVIHLKFASWLRYNFAVVGQHAISNSQQRDFSFLKLQCTLESSYGRTCTIARGISNGSMRCDLSIMLILIDNISSHSTLAHLYNWVTVQRSLNKTESLILNLFYNLSLTTRWWKIQTFNVLVDDICLNQLNYVEVS